MFSLSKYTCVKDPLVNISIAEKLPLPLDIKTKKRFPTIGNLMLNVKFTNGLGLNDANKIKAAVNNQTKDTKDSLDPIREGKGSSSGLFSDSFRSTLSNSYWFRIFPVGGKPLNDVNIRSAIGGSYDISFDIRDAVSNLVSESIGKWWDPLDPEELTLEPRLLVDYSSPINSNFDPINFYHQNKNVSNLIDNVLKIEAEQTKNIDDLSMTDDLFNIFPDFSRSTVEISRNLMAFSDFRKSLRLS